MEKDKRAEYMKQYRAENKDKIAEYQKQYRVENKDKIAEYYAENKDKRLEYQKQYNKKQDNPSSKEEKELYIKQLLKELVPKIQAEQIERIK